MYKVLIADDEAIIREGIKSLFNWETLGFEVCGEAANGEQTLSLIRSLKPDVVLLDIRMPKMTGLEVISTARGEGFEGNVIILSGYSDFAYAQEAIRNRATDYLTKPVDEDDLEGILLRVKKSLDDQKASSSGSSELMLRAKRTMLSDIVTGKLIPSQENIDECGLNENCYQVIISEKYGMDNGEAYYDFSDLLKVSSRSIRSFEQISPEGYNCIILKGTSAISRFKDFISRYEDENQPQKGSPLDALFFTYGHIVEEPGELADSYREAKWLMSRRFFCAQGQHVLGFADLPELENTAPVLSKEMSEEYSVKLINSIASQNRNQVAEILTSLIKSLYTSSDSTQQIRLFLSDLFLQIKTQFSSSNQVVNQAFPTNAEALQTIQECHYLYEIVLYFNQTIERVMASRDNYSRDSVLNDVLYYVEHNYSDNITLESIAPLFGYNSSYLGKIFTKKMGETFNSYVERIRLEASKGLLLREDLKVYAIAEQVGYRNVDYFHIKFKKYTGMSPAEYRKKNKV